MKLKKGDKIKVITGKDKGREGVIERIYLRQGKILATGVNMVKKHVKKNEQMPQGGVVDLPRPMNSSKVMLVCPKCKKTAKIGMEIKNDRKFRVCRECKSKI